MRANLTPDDYPPIPPFSWKGGLSPLILVPAFLPAIALFLAPTNVMDAVPVFRVFADWMARRVPHMSGHADATQIPQVAMLVNCLVVVAAIVIALVFAAQSSLNYRYLYRRHVATGPHPLRTYGMSLLGAPLFVLLLACMVMIPGDPSWRPGATQSRTLTYGFLAVSVPWLAGMAVGCFPLVLRLFLDAFLFSRPVTIRD